jgi:hypothetical protein
MSSTQYGEIMADQTANCMDLGVIREEPVGKLPKYCHLASSDFELRPSSASVQTISRSRRIKPTQLRTI